MARKKPSAKSAKRKSVKKRAKKKADRKRTRVAAPASSSSGTAKTRGRPSKKTAKT